MTVDSTNGGTPREPTRWLKFLAAMVAAVAVGLIAAEVAARTDDAVFNDVPFLANPRYEDLLVNDGRTIRGRPHGQFGKWRLNEHGFRGPELVETRPACCPRVVILGASEAFGYLESPENEFPAIVRAELAKRGDCVEIINAALAGMTVRSMFAYWDYWVASFRPDIVLIYPSTHLYLGRIGAEPAAAASTAPSSVELAAPANIWSSRYLDRLRNVIETPEFIGQWRRERRMASLIAASAGEGPVFSAVPSERIDMLAGDLSRLVERIRHSGARPVLLTHAMRAQSPERPEDGPDLNAMRQFVPRAPEPVIAAFDVAANERIRALGVQLDVPVVDIAREVGGQRVLFGDLVHFTDAGAQRVGKAVSSEIARLTTQLQGCAIPN